MMKLSSTEKTVRKILMKELHKNNGLLFADRETGATMCFTPDSFAVGKIWRMSTSICNSKDKFSRKYGEYLALKRLFYNDEFILIPYDNIVCNRV
jgi:hypothetical protein